MNSTSHAGDEVLLRFIDDDLAPAEAWAVGTHLSSCDSCRSQLDDLNETLSEYQQFHETVLKTKLPPPPLPWKPLDFRAVHLRSARSNSPRLFASTARRASLSPWLAAAAALVAAYLGVNRLQHPPVVKAAELLNRAIRAEHAAPVRNRSIRIQTRRYHWDRPARLPAALPRTKAVNSQDVSGIRLLLESASYSLDDPLSAGAFSRWHDGLPEKQDQVAVLAAPGVPESYVIHTTTTASPISDASLTLRATDLHAVSCTLRFAAETVEMTEIADESPAPHSMPEQPLWPELAPAPSVSPVPVAGPRDELMVIAMLHRINADLGEPVAVRRSGPNVVVNVTGLDPRRQEEVKKALANVDAVRLVTNEEERDGTTGSQRRPPPQVDIANPLLAELQAAAADTSSTGEIGDQIVEYTESIIDRVYAVRALARKFGPDEVSQLSVAENALLSGLVRDHLAVIAAATVGMEHRLGPILPKTSAVPELHNDSWQTLADALLADARELDQVLNAAALPVDVAERKRRAAQALANIDQRIARIRAILRS